MTMPSLIANFQKKVISAQLKKFVSTINQAIDLAKAENGDYEYWNVAQGNSLKYANIFRDYLVPKLKINLSACENIDFDSHYAKTRTSSFNYSPQKEECIGVLSDGAIIFDIADINAKDDKYSIIYTAFMVDVNGTKPPNRGGKDMFPFAVWLKADCDERCGMQVGQYLGVSYGETGLLISGDRGMGSTSNPYPFCLFYEKPNPSYCALMLQENNWEFPKNYPWNKL